MCEALLKLFHKDKIAKPIVPILSMQGETVERELNDLAQKNMYCLLDRSGRYYYTTAEGWAEVFNYIYCNFDMPKYVAYRMDCDDFAFLLKGLVGALFGLNYFALTFGTIPQGGHAFNFYRDDQGHMLIEPQTGQFFPWGERSYEPTHALL